MQPEKDKKKKKSHAMTKGDSSQIHKDGSEYANQCIHHINKSQKPHDPLNGGRISIWQNPTPNIQHLVKTLTKVGIEGQMQHNKSHLWQTHSQYKTQRRKAKRPPAKIWNKTRMPTLTTFTQHSIRSPSHNNHSHTHTRKRKKRKMKKSKWIQQSSRIQN